MTGWLIPAIVATVSIIFGIAMEVLRRKERRAAKWMEDTMAKMARGEPIDIPQIPGEIEPVGMEHPFKRDPSRERK
jgi:hypothetical protein